MSLTIKAEMVSANAHVLYLNGRITQDGGATLLRDRLNELVQSGTRVILDMSAVDYVDSTGLGVIVSSYINAQRLSGKIILVGLGERLRDLLALTKLASIFEIYETVDEAKASLA